MHPQLRRRRTLEALKKILLGESLKQPVAVIFENLHWVDRESQAFLDLLVDSIISARVLLLVSYRPEYRHEWVNRAHYTQVRLDPLGAESAAQMLDALLGSQPELGPAKATIIEKTGGNPFFIEELVRALFEQGVLLRNGIVSLGKPLTAIKIPITVQGILASRVDRLPVAEKELLQVLAILGDGVPLSLVSTWLPRAKMNLRGCSWTCIRPTSFTNNQPLPNPGTLSSTHSFGRLPTTRS